MAQTEKRLTGEDSQLDLASLARVTTGTIAIGKFYRVVAKGGTSGFPGSLPVGRWGYATAVITLGTGDIADVSTNAVFIDGVSWKSSVSKSEIDTTTLSDETKSSRAGKPTITGSIEGRRIINDVAAADQIARNMIQSQFLPVVTQAGTGATPTFTLLDGTDDTVLWFFGYTNKTSIVGEVEEVLIMPVRMTGYELGAEVDGAQAVSISFGVDGKEKPQIFQRVIV